MTKLEMFRKKKTNMDSEMAANSERHNKLDLEASKEE